MKGSLILIALFLIQHHNRDLAATYAALILADEDLEITVRISDS